MGHRAYEVQLGDAAAAPIEVDVLARAADGGAQVRIGDATHAVRLRTLPDGRLELQVDGGPTRIYDAHRADRAWDVSFRGRTVTARAESDQDRLLRGAGGHAHTDGNLSVSMPGRVVKVLVAPGDAVAAGQPVLIVEAMKMENEVKSPVPGTVAEVRVAEGQSVEAGQPLVVVEPAPP